MIIRYFTNQVFDEAKAVRVAKALRDGSSTKGCKFEIWPADDEDPAGSVEIRNDYSGKVDPCHVAAWLQDRLSA